MSIELSNLRPAKGSVKSDNFRRGRGQGSETLCRLSDAFIQKNSQEGIYMSQP